MTNYLNQAINGSVRIAFVILPTIKAASHLSELALRALNAALSVINVQIAMPKKIAHDATKEEKEKASFASKVYTYVHDYLPASITTQNDAFKDLSHTDVVKGFAFYTATAIVATFVANKFIGQTPDVYNTVAKYAGSALRIDTNYDVIQMAINYVVKK